MKQTIKYFRISFVATLALGVAVSILYPVAVWGVAQVIFPNNANGSLIRIDGKVVGSRLLGQTFASRNYFHSRPSAAGKGYDAAGSSGSNLGPISSKFIDGVAADPNTKGAGESFAGLTQRVKTYREVNGLAADVKIPPDAVTASASGLDPHISVRNAELQTARVARERRLPENAVRKLVAEHTDSPPLGIFGEAGVNVLELNLALDSAGK